MVVGTASALPALEMLTKATVMFGKAQIKAAEIVGRILVPELAMIADVVGLGVDLSLSKSDEKWDAWADGIIASIDKAQARAAETLVGPVFGPEPPPSATGGGRTGGKGGKGGGGRRKVDPLAALKKERQLLVKDLEMYRQSLKSRRCPEARAATGDNAPSGGGALVGSRG